MLVGIIVRYGSEQERIELDANELDLNLFIEKIKSIQGWKLDKILLINLTQSGELVQIKNQDDFLNFLEQPDKNPELKVINGEKGNEKIDGSFIISGKTNNAKINLTLPYLCLFMINQD